MGELFDIGIRFAFIFNLRGTNVLLGFVMLKVINTMGVALSVDCGLGCPKLTV